MGIGWVRSFPREEPQRGAVEFPGGAQCGQQTGRQQRGAVLVPFALIDADQHAVTCDVGEPQPHDFPDAQARGVSGHEQYPVPGVGGTAGTDTGVLRYS